MKWNTLIVVYDGFDTERLFKVETSLYSAPAMYPNKNMCKIEVEEVSKEGDVVEEFHFYVNLTDTVIVASTKKTMLNYLILDDMDSVVKTGSEKW